MPIVVRGCSGEGVACLSSVALKAHGIRDPARVSNDNLDELIRSGRNIQALAVIREQLGCGLTEAVDVLNELHVRLKAERPDDPPHQRPSTDDD